MMRSANNPPRVSVGLPVRDGEATLPRALDSLLAQTFDAFEIVVVDNGSTDRTREICLDYASIDSRVRYHRNEANIGQIANFNRAFELSRAEYFRWAGCNDWWEPTYLQRCVEALDREPSAVLVTCYQAHYDDAGNRFYQEYTGSRVDSGKAHRRFARLLWFLRHSRYLLDPIYSMMRRSALQETNLLPPMLGTDLVLAAELSLVGPWCHVPECLAYRRITSTVPRPVLARRFDPRVQMGVWSLERICRAMAARVASRPMGAWAKAACYLSLVRHYVAKTLNSAYRRCRSFVGGLTRYQSIKKFLRRRSVGEVRSE